MRRTRSNTKTTPSTTLSSDDDDDDDIDISLLPARYSPRGTEDASLLRAAEYAPGGGAQHQGSESSEDDDDDESELDARADDATYRPAPKRTLPRSPSSAAEPPRTRARRAFVAESAALPVSQGSGDGTSPAYHENVKRRKQFEELDADALAAEYAPPTRGDPLEKFQGWRRREIAVRRELANESWYRFAVQVAGLINRDVKTLIAVPSPTLERGSGARPRLSFHDGYGATSILNRLVPLDDAAGVRGAPPPPPPPPATELGEVLTRLASLQAQQATLGVGLAQADERLATELRERLEEVTEAVDGIGTTLSTLLLNLGRGVPAPFTPPRGSRAPMRATHERFIAAKSGASPEYKAAVDSFLVELRAAVAPPAGVAAPAPPVAIAVERLRALRAREAALDMLRRAEERAEPSADPAFLASYAATGVAFETPIFTANVRAALDYVRQQLPALADVRSAEAFERSNTCFVLFAHIVAAFVLRAFFASPTRPTRASDYPRLGEGLTHALEQLERGRAHYSSASRSVELEYSALARSSSSSTVRTCPTSAQLEAAYATRAEVLGYTGFAPLGGSAARLSPYGARGIGFGAPRL